MKFLRSLRIFKRLWRLEKLTRPCGRCGCQMDISVVRVDGPRLITNGSMTVLVCTWCQSRAKQLGWKLVKPATEGAKP